MMMTNLSIQDSTYSGMVLGASDNFNSAYVNSGITVQMAHAVFFPCPAKLDTLSHHVSAWNFGNARAISAPRPAAISLAAKYLKLFPVPNANQICTDQILCVQIWQWGNIS